MCTFKITDYVDKHITDNKLILGGPDASNTIDIDGLYITHHLLQVTGKQTVQPVESKGLHYLLLGEVYNYDDTLPSDIYYVIDCYEKYGDDFLEHLDGEFLVIIIDSGVIKFFTDPWGTRQSWFSKNDEHFYFATYPLDIDKDTRLQNNSQYNFDIKTKELVQINSEIHKWNLNQFKDNIDDVTLALEQAIDKRYHPKSFLLLSGGIDSAVVAVRLADTKKQIQSATINYVNSEDLKTQSQVIEYCKEYNDNKIFYRPEIKPNFVTEYVEQYYNQQCKVMLTGNGSDEIFCNYHNKPKVMKPEFDRFPSDLTKVFPWINFYNGHHRTLINRWEIRALTYGLEIRSVFLDKNLIQEWLNLSVFLKNKEHKYFLKEYLRKKNINIPSRTAGMKSQNLWEKK
jgi:asparagine synthetase B (glutamine-hydrolysing)